jgi:hypothetical protein
LDGSAFTATVDGNSAFSARDRIEAINSPGKMALKTACRVSLEPATEARFGDCELETPPAIERLHPHWVFG